MTTHTTPNTRKRLNISLVFGGLIVVVLSAMAIFAGDISEANATLIAGLVSIFFGSVNGENDTGASVGETIASLAVQHADCRDDLADCMEQLEALQKTRNQELLDHTSERIRLIYEKNIYWKLLRERQS